MTKFELYEKRRYRRIPLQDHDGVYCIVSNRSSATKAVTVSVAEFSQEGFKFSVTPTMMGNFVEVENLSLKAIVGSRNLTFADPIAFEVKWQEFDFKTNRTYIGCKICKITSESEQQFISFITQELNFAGQWGQDRRYGSPNLVDAESKPGALPDSLRNTEKRFEGFFNNNHTVMLVINPETADIVDANPAAAAYYGWSHEELTNKKITEINVLCEKQVFQEMEKARSEHRNHFIFQHRRSNGDIRDVEVFTGPVQFCGKHFLYSIVHDISDRKHIENERDKLIKKLRAAVKEIKALRGILPICSFCYKIRDDKGHWENVDVYLGKYSQADISHSICPECAQKHYSVFLRKVD